MLNPDKTDFADALVRAAVREQTAIKEHFIAQYLAATGARIQDTALIEQRSPDGRTTRYWCEPIGTRAMPPDLATTAEVPGLRSAQRFADLMMASGEEGVTGLADLEAAMNQEIQVCPACGLRSSAFCQHPNFICPMNPAPRVPE